MTNPTPSNVKGYDLGEMLGVGGFGAVYRARQTIVDREVAIKVILPKYANEPEFIRSFETEAQTIARLEHPFIVPLFDFWREPDSAYLVMRFLRGGSLRERLKQGNIPVKDISHYLDNISAALDFAHRSGVVHRDLKPDNILLDEDGNAYLTDFGIARNVGRRATSDTISGSIAYISPDQLQNEAPTAQADIYSLGIMLYEMLTGQHPYGEVTTWQMINSHLQEPLPDLDEYMPELPYELDIMLKKATSKEAQERHKNAREVYLDFQRAIKADLNQIDTAIELFEIINPFKGLRAFQEADAADFFGREQLTNRLLERFVEPHPYNRFLAVVGPSGSGKSSAVLAGLVPQLRSGAIDGSDNWFVLDFVPGVSPLRQLEAALLSISLRPPSRLYEMLQADKGGLTWAVDRVLADVQGELVIIIDQFEEVFTMLEDEEERLHFLELLKTAITDPESRLRVIITLRADFTDRPLEYTGFGELMNSRTEFVLPLSASEIERAITGPAHRVGLQVDTDLIAAIIADLSEEPGALPLLQYALTEIFERRSGNRMTLNAYHELGGVRGAIARRAEEVFVSLSEEEKLVSRQILLRMVTLGEGTEDTRRRAKRTELTQVVEDQEILNSVLDAFGKPRLLSFDVDLSSREPMIEVAHEALIREWQRLRDWLNNSRNDLRLQRVLAGEATEWEKAGKDPSFLLSGSRLSQYEEWQESSDIALSQLEKSYLDASKQERQRRNAAELERKKREEEIAARASTFEERAKQLRRAAVILAVVIFLAIAAAVFLSVQVINTQSQVAVGQTQIAAVAPTVESANTQIAAVQPTLNAANQQIEVASTQISIADEQLSTAALQIASATAQISTAEAQINVASSQVAVGETQVAGFAPTLESANAQITLANEQISLASTQVAGVEPTLNAANAQVTAANLQVVQGQTQVAAFEPTLNAANSEVTAANALVSDGQTQVAAFVPTLNVANTQVAGIAPTLVAANSRIDVANTEAALAAERVDTANTEIAGVQPTLAEANQRIENASTELAGVQPTLDSAQEEINFADTQVAAGQTQVAGVQPTLEAANTQIAGVEPTLNVANTQIAGIVPTLNSVETEVESQRGVANALRLVRSSSQLLEAGDPDLAMSLALYAYQLNPQLGEVQRILNDAVPLTVRLNTEGSVSLFTNDGRWLVVGSESGLEIWDLATRGLLHHLDTESVSALVLSPDDEQLIVGGREGTIYVFDTRTGLERFVFTEHTSRISSLAYSPSARQVISGDRNGNVYIWDTEVGQRINELPESQLTEIVKVTFNENGSAAYSYNFTLVTNSRTFPARIGVFNPGQQGAFRTSPEYRGFSPDGRLAYTGADGRDFLRLYDADSTVEQRVFRLGNANTDYIEPIAFSEDGRYLLVESESRNYNNERTQYTILDRYVALWEIATGGEIRRFNVSIADPTAWDVNAIAFSADGRLALLGGRYNTINVVSLWDVNTGEELRRFTGHSNTITEVAFSRDGQYAFSHSSDDNLRVWDIGNIELNILNQTSVSADSITAFGISSDGNIAYVAVNNRSITSYNLISNQEIPGRDIFTGEILKIAFNPMQSQVLVVAVDSMALYNLETGERLYIFQGIDPSSVSAISFSPDGQFLFYVSGTELIRWELSSRSVYQALNLSMRGVNFIAPSSNNEFVAIASRATIQIFDLITSDIIQEFEQSAGPINSLDYSPNGDTILTAIGEPSNAVVVWDLRTGLPRYTLIAHRAAVNIAQYSADGLSALSGSDDLSLILWDLTTGQAIRQYRGHNAAIRQLVFNPMTSTAQSISSILSDGIVTWRVETISDTVNWVYANRYVREINCVERIQYGVSPACEGNIIPSPAASPTSQATATPLPTATPRPTLTPSPTPIPTARISTDGASVNVRSGAGAGFSLVTQVSNGTVVEILETMPEIGWVRIRLPDGTEGWVQQGVLR